MAYKKFDKKLYEQNDAKAREIAKKYFARYDYKLLDNPDQYGVDLICYEKIDCAACTEDTVESCETCHGLGKTMKPKMYVEVEIKRVWKDEEFPYGSVQFPERKWKFCKLDAPVAFFMLNNECSRAVLVTGEDLINSPLKRVSNIYMRKDENFFQVPLDKATFIEV